MFLYITIYSLFSSIITTICLHFIHLRLHIVKRKPTKCTPESLKHNHEFRPLLPQKYPMEKLLFCNILKIGANGVRNTAKFLLVGISSCTLTPNYTPY